MKTAPTPVNEQARLAALAEYRVLDTEAEEIFDAITRIAAYLCDVPIALISLVDRDRQWFKAVCGLNDVRETSRDIAFCSHAILSPGLMEVQDTARDARFHDNPLVTGEPKIRFYAGMPLINPQGHKLGTLCVIDRRPKRLTESQRAALQQLSELVVRLFESRKTEFKAQRLDASLACVNRARRVLAECNNAQARVTTESELLRELCRILVESVGYRQAWVGMPVDDAVRSIAVAAAAGCGDDHPLAAHASWANDGRYQGAMGQVIATGEPYLAQNILTDPKFVRRHKRALECGYQSSATLPLSLAGRCIGAVSIYASEPDAFDTEEVELLKTLAQGVSYGIASLRERAARAQVEERFRATFEQAAVGMAHTTTEGRFLQVNSKLCQILGYTSPELLVLTTRDLTHPDDRDKQDALRLELLAGRRSSFTADKRYVRKDGSEIWVNRTVTLARHPVTGEHYLIQVIEDISERKSTETRLARLTRARRVMAECNHILAHAADETKMLEDMCRVVVDSGGYRLAWVGLATGDPMRPVYPAAHVGYGGDAPMTGSVAWSADGRYQGFMHKVVTTGEPHIARDILNDPKYAPRRARALQHGFQSSIALPLGSGGRILGAIAVYAREPDAFDADEIALLTELADDIAFGIASLRTRIAQEQAEQLSRESEKRFRETFEQAAVGITRVDLNGVLVDFNQKFCDMLGYSREELLGKAIKDITHPDDYGRGAQYRAQLAHRAMKSAAGEKRFVRKDGTIMWARRTMSTALDDAGKPQYVISVVEDITERKELEHRFEMTFNQAAVGMTQTGLDGRLLQVNRKYAEMLGYSREEMVGMSAMEVTHPDDRAETGPLREKLLKGELESVAGEKRLVRKDGRVIWVTRTFSLARGVSGEPLCFITVVEDITGRKELERRYRETFDQAAVGIVHTAIDGRYLQVNQKFCEMLGYSESELVGRLVANFAHPEDREKGRNQRQLLWEGKLDKFNEEKRYLRKDGSVVWTNRTVSLARDASGKPMYFIRVIEDITERKEVEERYRATFDNAPVGIMHTAIDDYRILHANSKLCEMLGYTQDELLSMTSTDVVHPDYRFTDQSKYKEQILSGESQSFASERKFIRKDGSSLWVSRTVSLVKDASGNPLYFIRIIEDISERKRAETALRESEETLRATFAQASVGIHFTSVDGRFLQVNDKYCDMLGYAREELLRMHVADINFPGHKDDAGNLRKRVISREINAFSLEKPLRRKDGSPVWTIITASAVRGADGALSHFVSVVQDISERKQAEEAQRASEATLRATFEQAGVGIALRGIDPRNPRWLRVNQKLCDILGYTREELLQLTSVDVTPPEERDLAIDYNEQLLRGEIESYSREKRYMRKDGKIIWADISLAAVRGLDSRPTHIISVVQDVTARKRAETALRESEERYRDLFELSPLPMWVWDNEKLSFLAVNQAAIDHYGYTRDEFLRMNVRDIWAPGEESRYEENLRDRAQEQALHLQRKHRTRDGRIIDVEVTARRFMQGGHTVWLTLINDVTERKLAEERLMHLAHYDVLTSLPNRVLFYDRLRQALAQAKRNEWTVGVMFIDVDRFKNVNDTLGHAVGDKLLQQVSERLTGSVRSGDTVGRLGGDEFAIVLSNLSSAQDANLVAQKIMTSFSEPFKLEGSEIYVTASIGITLYPDDSNEQDTLIKNADAAMYRAKEVGRNSYQFYTPEMNARALEILSMESSLRRALDRNEFLLYFQPKTSIADGNIVGVEALMRWRHPERGMVSPVEFMPVLEETGLIVPVGEWVLKTVCAQIKAWEGAGVKPVPVAVNLSARQFTDRNLGPTIQRILEERQVDPALIELEITESSLMANTEEAVKTLEYLENLGAGLSIDDFGTGYSSLGYLKRFPLTSLKIDSSFVRDLTTDSDDATITRAVISMAHSLGLKVIAEGVETESQLAFLAEYGCDEIQGYYFSRPLPAEDCGTWLREGRRLQRPLPVADSGAPFVLLVDDDDDTLTLLKRSLAKDGYRILTARNAHEALDLLGKHHVDAVISDQNMPGIPGVEFLQHIKTLFPQTVRMMTSGHADVQTMADAVNKGEIYRFLPKGQDEDRLRADVREALQARAGNGR